LDHHKDTSESLASLKRSKNRCKALRKSNQKYQLVNI